MFKPTARFTSAITLAQQLVAPAAASADGEQAAANSSANDETAPAAAGGSSSVADGHAAGGNGSSSGGQLYSQQRVDNFVHMVYGMSKDWCASGLRVGVLYSRNERLQQVWLGPPAA